MPPEYIGPGARISTAGRMYRRRSETANQKAATAARAPKAKAVKEPAYPRPYLPVMRPATVIDTVLHQISFSEYVLGRFGVDLTQSGVSASLGRAMQGKSADTRRALATMHQDWSPFFFWKKHRMVYAPHPSLSQALIRSGVKGELPADVLRRLPHPDPLYVLPRGVPIRHIDGGAGRLIGFLVTGGIKTEGNPAFSQENMPPGGFVGQSTHDPGTNCLHITAVSECFSEDGTQVTVHDWCHISIPMDRPFTIDSLTEEILSRFSVDPLSVGTAQRNHVREYIRSVAQAALPHLLYVASANAEIDKPRNDIPPRSTTRTRTGRDRKAARLMPIGFRMGAALDRYQRTSGNTGGPSGTTGTAVTPHLRAAHFHSYRVGPRHLPLEERERILHWLDPIPVNAHLPVSTDDYHAVLRTYL
jgi:hypothetical protein